MRESSDRLSWISFLQVYAIILVVIGHSFYHHEDNIVYEWIYSFHMPLFFFISGHLLHVSVKRSGKPLGQYFGWRVLAKRARRLLLPYWLISSLVFVPKSFLGNFAGREVDFSWTGYAHMLLYPLDNVISIYWFLPTLFLVFCIAFVGAKLSLLLKSRYWILPVLAGSYILALYFPRYSDELLNYPGVIAFLFYFVLGYAFDVDFVRAQLLKDERVKPVPAMLFGVAMCFVFYTFSGHGWSHPFYGILGIIMSLCLSGLYVQFGCRFFSPFYGSTYAIYLFSWFFQVASQQLFLSVTGLPWGYGSALAMVSGFFGPFAIFKLWKAVSVRIDAKRGASGR